MTNLKVLHHTFMSSDNDFFRRIDECGGWPHDAKFVVMRHGCRSCYFSNDNVRDGWNTTLYSSDDYYWWKLSEEAKETHRSQARHKFANEMCRLA